MQKRILIISMFIFLLLVFISCSSDKQVEQESSQSGINTGGDTGYPSGTMQFIYLYHDGKLYTPTYRDEDCIKDGKAYATSGKWKLIGKTVREENEKWPDVEMVASRVLVGTEVYYDNLTNDIFILREDNILMRCVVAPDRGS